MANQFTKTDVFNELTLQTPSESHRSTEAGFHLGSERLEGIRADLFRLFHADPDNLFGLLQIVASRLVSLSNSMINDIASVETLLAVKRETRTTFDENTLDEIIEGFGQLTSGSLGKRRRELKRVRLKVKNYVDAARRGGVIGLRDYEEVAGDAVQIVASLDERFSEIVELHDNFTDAIDAYMNSGLFLDAMKVYAELTVQRLEDFQELGGSNSSLAAIAATVGVSLADIDVVSPIKHKYKGKITVLPGTAASVTATKSLPVVVSALESTSLTVDGVSGAFRIAQSGLCTKVVQPRVTVVGAAAVGADPNGEISVFNWPAAGSSTFKILKDNTTYNVTVSTVASEITSLSVLATKINSALATASAGITCTLTDTDYLTFTYTSAYGTKSRLAFYDSSGGGNDVNAVFDLTYASHGEINGTDSTLADCDTTTVTPTITSTVEHLASGVTITPGIASGKTTLTFTTDYGIVADDVVRIDDVYYRVQSVLGLVVTLDQEILGTFDGTTFTASTGAARVVDVYREYATVTSTSKVWNTTSVDFVTASSLGFSLTEDVGKHTEFTLDAAPEVDGVIRAGDVLLTNTDAETKVAQVVGKSGATLICEPVTNLTTNDVRIYSSGVHTYRPLANKFFAIDDQLESLPDLVKLQTAVNAHFGGSQAESEAKVTTGKYKTLLQLIVDSYGTYKMTVPQDLRIFLKQLGEARLDVLREYLTTLDLTALFALEPEDLSRILKIDQDVQAVLDYLNYNEEVAIVTPDVSEVEFYVDSEDELGEYPESAFPE